MPGFSTAAKVTSISGRGVGMDVVRSNIEQIGGTVDLKSTLGSGTTFTIKIPLTLAIVSALIVEAGGERFAIPQLSVLELVRASNGGEHRIERIKDAPVLRLRNKLLPLIQLKELLHLGEGRDDRGFVVVTQVGSQIFGVLVEGVFHTEEIVIKPMSSKLRHITAFSGTTILGDGTVIMIVDPNGIAQALGRIAPLAQGEKVELDEAGAIAEEDLTPLLVFRAGSQQPKAVLLSLVARLEEIDCRRIETSDGQYLVQYRDQLMPLVRIDGEGGLKQDGSVPVLVFSDRIRRMGLIVDEIIDIVEQRLDIEVASERPGLLGYAVVKGSATEIIDIAHFLPQAYADWFRRGDPRPVPVARRIMLVDDFGLFPRHARAGDQGRGLSGEVGCVGRRCAGGDSRRRRRRYHSHRHRDARHGRFRAGRGVAPGSGDRRHSGDRAFGDGLGRRDRARPAGRFPRFRRQVRSRRADRGDQGADRRSASGGVSDGSLRTRCTTIQHSPNSSLSRSPARSSVCRSGASRTCSSRRGLRRVPLAGAEIAGVLNLRGRIVTAIDMRQRLERARSAKTAPLPWRSASKPRGESFGLLVDAVGEVLKLPDVDREPNPINLGGKLAALSDGVYRLEGQLLVVLDVDRVLDLRSRQAAA